MVIVTLLGIMTAVCLVGLVALIAWKPKAAADGGDGGIITATVVAESDTRDGTVVRGADGKARVLSAAEVRQRQFEERMMQAGLYRKGSTSRFLVLQILMGLIPAIAAIVCVQLQWVTVFQAVLLAAIPAIGGLLGPGLYLDRKKAGRQLAIRRALPDALDVIVVCLEAGLSMSAALVKVGKELRNAYPLLASELTIVHREVQMGNAIGEALLHFSNRFDLDELRSLSLVVRQAEKFGASLSSALRVHAETLRVKRLQQAQERAQKAAVKLLFPTVFCIFPALFVVILGPAAFDVYRSMMNNASNQSSSEK